MSALGDRLSGLHRAGHAASAPQLWPDRPVADGALLAPAAVLVAFTDRAEPGMLLLHRPAHMRAHPGQIAFPGGRCDPGEDAATAALREAHEELGIDPALPRIIGAADLHRTGSGYVITPVLAVVPADITITPNHAEVADWFEAPAGFLLDPANHVRREAEIAGSLRPVLEIIWRQHRIWGVTAAIIANLGARLRWHG